MLAPARPPFPCYHPSVMPQDVQAFQTALLNWFAAHRREMPFRETTDPYAVWISEIMLQQTTVAAVTPYWERFMARFPTVRALADAPLDDVLHAWAGLGYYSRARNLHAAARRIVETHDGEFPNQLSDVLALPGVGRYTAGAILSFAFNDDQPVVDANVARVMARVCLIPGDPKSTPTNKALWTAAEQLLARGRARDWNLALFDLGATICVPVEPKCDVCPVSAWCEAWRQGRQNEFPQHAPRIPLTPQTDVAAIIRDTDGHLLMVQRPPTGVWAGMWELPRGTLEPGEKWEDGLRRIVSELLGITIQAGPAAATVKHGVMRRSITLVAFPAEIVNGTLSPDGPTVWRWVAPEETDALAVSSPQRRILAALRKQADQTTLF